MLIKTKALVIKQRNIGDNDKIITILSEKLGVIEFSVKNFYRNKSNTSCQLLCYSEFCLFKGKNSYSLNSSFSLSQHYKLREDVKKMSLACYFCDLLSHVSPHDETIDDILNLTLNCFYLIEGDKMPFDLVKAIYEMRLMVLSGFAPYFVGCKICSDFESNEYTFYLDKGYIVCGDCINKQKIISKLYYPIYPPVFAAIRHIIYSKKEKLFSFNINGIAKEQLLVITQSYILLYVDVNVMKSLEVYNSL